MKKALLLVFAVFVVLLAGIGAYWLGAYRGAQANDLSAEQVAEMVKPVKVTFEVIPPEGTPADQTLYLSGSVPALGTWDAAGVPLEPADDGKYRVTVELSEGITYEFKVTRGTWGTVERNAEGQDMPDRTIKPVGNETMAIAVATWIDEGKSVPGRITLTGDIREFRKFRSEVQGEEGDLLVFLPPGYGEADRRYPVIYMNDGQNLFNEGTAVAGIEWHVDETATRLINSGQIEPVIIVGMFNTEKRSVEFVPPSSQVEGEPGQADVYAAFVVDKVKPQIDRLFFTQPEAEHTTIVGTGLGGVVTLYIARQNKDTFGNIVVMSPWHHGGESAMVESILADGSWMQGKRFWVDDDRLAAALESAGLTANEDFAYEAAPDDGHTEARWGERFENTLLYLYPNEVTANGASASAE